MLVIAGLRAVGASDAEAASGLLALCVLVGVVVVAAVGIARTAGTGWLTAASSAPGLVFVPPVFDPIVIVSLGLPLFIVTMAGQNVPGFVVMSTFGYRPAPRAVLVGSGLATAAGSVFGAHSINLAAITAALMASPDAHPDKSKRWIATATSGVTYLVLGLGAGFAAALEDPHHHISAIATFLVTASGLSIVGIVLGAARRRRVHALAGTRPPRPARPAPLNSGR